MPAKRWLRRFYPFVVTGRAEAFEMAGLKIAYAKGTPPMTRFKIGPQTVISAALALLLFSSLAWQSALAQVAPRLPDAPQGQPPSTCRRLRRSYPSPCLRMTAS